MALILTIFGIFVLLVGFEAWARKYKLHSEFSRKFIHIIIGSFAAFWPFYLAWHWIVVISVAFVVVVLVSKHLNIFKSIHTVERPTWGEAFFALAVGGLTFVTHQPWVYAVAILHMGLADGMAAITGVTWGKSTRYRVFGYHKSIVGSLTFFAVSVALLVGYSLVALHGLHPGLIIGLALSATVIENLGVYGLDNLLAPLLVGVVLTLA